MGGKEIEEFLTHLAVEENVAASTQNQALNAILFLYKEVLKQELDLKVDAVRAKRSRYLPTVLTKEEVLAIINNLSGVYQLVVKLLYGTGLRQTECLQLRVCAVPSLTNCHRLDLIFNLSLNLSLKVLKSKD
jgi:site-specific recombinase XerD